MCVMNIMSGDSKDQRALAASVPEHSDSYETLLNNMSPHKPIVCRIDAKTSCLHAAEKRAVESSATRVGRTKVYDPKAQASRRQHLSRTPTRSARKQISMPRCEEV
mmetsp:Transcript_7953/g.21073  ORF Transcript_7953/g.21073 Transcript_7953/m.21073 type:complete len:106 (-) Transcript_7953:156-473(-)